MTTATLGIAVTSNADKAAVDLDQLAQAAGRAEAGVTQLAGAAVKTGAATQQMSLNSANIAAQLQDVAVSAQMGMNPLQVALQQGTQLSAVLNQVRANGQGVGSALATSFMSIVNPISLVTIGAIALGTVALQALGTLTAGADDATEALEKHHDELSRVVTGYDDAESAVKDFIAETERLPRGAVQIELGAEFERMQERVQEFRDFAFQLGPALAGSLSETDREVSGLLTRFNEGQMSAEDLVVELTRLANTDFGPLGFGLADMVKKLLDGATQAAALEGSLVGISHALAGTAVNGGLQMALDSRIESERSAAAHQIELDAIKAVTPAQLAEIARRRERLKLVDEEITEALREQKIREAGEVAFAKAAAKTGKSATRDMDRWENTTGDFQKRIDQLMVEVELFGQSTFEIERQKAALDLLSDAKKADIEITPAVTAEIARLSEEYARASLMMEGVRLEAENRTPFEELGEEISRLNELLDEGAISWDTYTRAMGGATASAVATTLGALANLSQGLSNAFEENKALSIATAVLKGAEAIASAYATGNSIGGPVVGAAFAAVAAITAAANVAAVASTTKNSKSIGSGGKAGATGSAAAEAAKPQPRSIAVNLMGESFSRDSVSSLFDRLNEELGVDGLQIVTTHKQA